MNQQTGQPASAAPQPVSGSETNIGKIATTAILGAVTAVITEHLNVPQDEAQILLTSLSSILRRLFGHHTA